ncbi:MAG: ATP-binding protein [Candidatus Dormibacteraceae bacterium]
MTLGDQQLLQQNPWWSEPEWPTRDPHLANLSRQPAILPIPVVVQLPLGEPGLHTIRGPRQVGKSTTLKLIVDRTLKNGWSPRAVMYITADLLIGQPPSALYEAVLRVKEMSRASGPNLVLLDEATMVRDWDIAIKSLWDDGPLRDDVVICTGSSAVDMHHRAAERWPGRRGAGDDHLILPHSFPDFASALEPSLPTSPRATVVELTTASGRDALLDAQIHMPTLRRVFDLYLRFGGMPAAVADAVSGTTEPSERVMKIVVDGIVRDVARRGAQEPAARALLERVARSLSSKASWSALAEDMDVPIGARSRGGPTANTARDYIQFLAHSYLVLVVYAWRADRVGSDLPRDKKLYFGDPLIASTMARITPGLRLEDTQLVENVLAIALLRRYEPGYLQLAGFAAPTNLHSWRTSSGGEIDFVMGSRDLAEVVESKYSNKITGRHLQSIKAAFGSRPAVVASKDILRFENSISIMPASMLAWALG